MDQTLKQIIAELVACSQELDRLRAHIAQLEAERGAAIQPD